MLAQEEEQLGWKNIASGHLEHAESHFRRALELDPFRADALNGLGTVYLEWGELAQALELFQMAIAQAELGLPRKKRHTGWEDESVRPYLRGLHHLAMTLSRLEYWDGVREALEELLAWDPAGMGGAVFSLLGHALHRCGKLPEALHAYREASESAEVQYSIGLIYFESNRAKEAEKAWRRAIGQLPDVVPLVRYYPVVQPINGASDSDFGRAARYVGLQRDLWTDGAREALGRVADSLGA
ncbi:MAG: tetratricopeptide repeat protein [Sulfobacillus sp.]